MRFEIIRSLKIDLHEFNTSDYSAENQFNNMPFVNKEKLCLRRDECNGNIFTEFIEPRSMMYSVKIEIQNIIKKTNGGESSSREIKNRV